MASVIEAVVLTLTTSIRMSGEVGLGGGGEEVGQLLGEGDVLEDGEGDLEVIGVVTGVEQPVVFEGEGVGHEVAGDGGAVVERGAVVDPLPELAAGDLGGGGVLHEVVDGHGAAPGEPGG